MAEPIIVIKEGGGNVRGRKKGQKKSGEKAGEEKSRRTERRLVIQITDSNPNRPPPSDITVPDPTGGSGRIMMRFKGVDHDVSKTITLKFRVEA